MTPTQEASSRTAEAIFSNPDLRDRFEKMAKESDARVPVPDDFAWLVGRRVMVRTAANVLLKATITAVPREWRDRTRSAVVTTKGVFPKAWVRIEGQRQSTPWPFDDVFTDLVNADRAVAEHAH